MGRKKDRTDEQNNKAVGKGLESLLEELWGINHIPDLYSCLKGMGLSHALSHKSWLE